MADGVKMIRIGKTVLLKGADGVIKAGVGQGHNDEQDMKRVTDFGIVVDVDAIASFLGIQSAPKKSTKKKASAPEEKPVDDAE